MAAGSLDGTVLVSFFTTGGLGGPGAALSLPLRVQGTVAFASPAGSATCSVLGLIDLDLVDQLTF